MKLIDLDAFRTENMMAEDCSKCERNRHECGMLETYTVNFCEMLDDAPIIDAIPIDWLKANANRSVSEAIRAWESEDDK